MVGVKGRERLLNGTFDASKAKTWGIIGIVFAIIGLIAGGGFIGGILALVSKN